jgi:hypothetical protein
MTFRLSLQVSIFVSPFDDIVNSRLSRNCSSSSTKRMGCAG